jgi:sialidase-1
MITLALTASTSRASQAVIVFQNGTEGYNAYRIPAIVRAANGDLLAFCEAREGGDASEIDLVMKRSTDAGLTWGPLQVIQESDDFRDLFEGEPPPITVGNPAPVVDLMDPDHPGRIWMPFTLENDRVFVTLSDDHGQSWSPRREITDDVKHDAWGWYATGPVHSIQIQRGPHQGRLVVPCDHRYGDDGADRGPNGVHVFYSDDHGSTWVMGAIDDTYQDGLNANETTVVELNNGNLYFNTRDQNGPAEGTRGDAYSSDGGETFLRSSQANYKWFTPSSPVLDPPVVQSCVLRASSTLDGDGRNVILFSGPDENGPSGPGRSDLRIRYSVDETETWQDGLLIHTGPAAYSDMVRLSADGDDFGILFEAGEPPAKRYDQIRFTTFSLGDLDGLSAR